MFINPSIHPNKRIAFYHNFIYSPGPEAAGVGLSCPRMRAGVEPLDKSAVYCKPTHECTSLKWGRLVENPERTQATNSANNDRNGSKKRAKAPSLNMWCCPWCWSNFQLWLLYLFCFLFVFISLSCPLTFLQHEFQLHVQRLVVQGHVAVVLYFPFCFCICMNQSNVALN